MPEANEHMSAENTVRRDATSESRVPLLLAALPGCMMMLGLLGVPYVNTPEGGILTPLLLFVLAAAVSRRRLRRLAAWCFPALGVFAFEVIRWRIPLLNW